MIWLALAAWIAAPFVVLGVAVWNARGRPDVARDDVGTRPRPHVGLDVEQVSALNAQRSNPRRLGRWDGNPRA